MNNSNRDNGGRQATTAAPVSSLRLDEARQFVRIALDLRRDGRSRASGRFAKRALSLFARESRTNDYDAIVAGLCLADSRFARDDFSRAEADYRDALSAIDSLVAATPSLDVRNVRVQAIQGLANVALARGETAQAELELIHALDMAELTSGSAHESNATLMDDLATLYREAGRYDEAARLHHFALQITEQAVGIEHPQAATILEHLAMLECARGQCVIGERFAHQAIAIQTKAFGRDHPRVAQAFVVLASMLDGQGRCFEANQARQAARTLAQHWFGDDLEELAGSGLITATTPSRSDRRSLGDRVAGVGPRNTQAASHIGRGRQPLTTVNPVPEQHLPRG